ncbi:hypothetical protein A6E08_05005 [Vibrio lentus]|nr:hypothetical protein A6E08_05005 [Vibrio lentus]PMI57217.1 hypothetical protein BCU41_07715 [Vibrio lentus]
MSLYVRTKAFYRSRKYLIDGVLYLAREVGVKLNVIDTLFYPRLNDGLIANQCCDLNDYELYCCGPDLFSIRLKKKLDDYQFDIEKYYHEELLVMR